MTDEVIVCCALSGVAANRNQCPAIPYTPDDYAAESRRAFEAGAAEVHIHARHPDGTPSFDAADYKAITDAILAEVPEIIINYSTGAVGVPKEQRVTQIVELRPEIGALNMGSMNYAIWSKSQQRFILDMVFANPFSDITFFLDAMVIAGTKPEYECFDAGHVNNVKLMTQLGYEDPKPHISLIMGVHGGINATAQNLLNQVALLPENSHWQVIGVRNPEQWRMISVALGAGGSVRVGLEDNFYTPDGVMAKSNGDLVSHAVKMAHSAGRPTATPKQARARLGLPDPVR